MEKIKAAYEKAVEAVAKQQGTIARHEKSLSKLLDALKEKGVNVEDLKAAKWDAAGKSTEHYWDICKAQGKADDLERAKKTLAERERIAETWFEKLGSKQQQQTVFEELPAIILEFAARYKTRCIGWLLEGVAMYESKMAEIEEQKSFKDRKELAKERAEIRQAFGGTIITLAETYSKERPAKVEALAERQRVDLLQTMVLRVTEKTGKITDATGLAIGMNGEINGRVIGDKGGATISTILAGGYNIQCLHYRVLVKN